MIRLKKLTIIASIVSLFLIQFEATCQETSGLINIGTHQLYYVAFNSEAPSVVIDVGFGESYQSWLEMAKTISEYTRVVLYDRAGYGHSEPGPMPRTCKQVAIELKKLLESANIPPTYIIVGHSLGGLNMQYFASQYSEIVAGMLLLDPPPLDWILGKGFHDLRKMADKETNSLKTASESLIASENQEDRRRGKFFETLYSEHYEMFNLSAQLMSKIHTFGKLPLTVVASGKPNNHFGREAEEFQKFWNEHCEKISLKSKLGKYILVSGSSHQIHLDASSEVIKEIKSLIKKVAD